MGPGCCLCWYKNSSFSAPPPPALHPGLLRYKTVASLPLPHQRMHSGRYPLLNSNPSRWACSLFSTDGLHAKVSPSGRAVFSAASVRSCSLRRLFGCVKWRWKPARNNPLGSNLRKTRQLAVYKVVGGGRGGEGVPHQPPCVNASKYAHCRIQNVQWRKQRNSLPEFYPSFISSDYKLSHCRSSEPISLIIETWRVYSGVSLKTTGLKLIKMDNLCKSETKASPSLSEEGYLPHRSSE